ncbi:MAG: YHS domain-containing protein [Thermoplasmata archaeon]
MRAEDPVCKMMVDTNRAAACGTYAGTTVYFCSVGCQKTYEKTAPQRSA